MRRKDGRDRFDRRKEMKKVGREGGREGRGGMHALCFWGMQGLEKGLHLGNCTVILASASCK